MGLYKKYVVYSLNGLASNYSHKALEEIQFNNNVKNEFDSEDEAVDALINDEKTYKEYVILKNVYIHV